MPSEEQLTCAIIDDDEINRLTLEHYISLTPNLTLVTSLPDGIAGLDFFRSGKHVDILFLDVQMPHLSGLELLRLLPVSTTEVVLTTGREDFAVDAFELSVTDYLVKPFDYARFSRSVQRVQQRREALASAPEPVDTSMFVKVNNKMVRINFDEVLYVEALSDYVIIVTPTQKHIVYTTLKGIDARLPFDYLVRVHRSYIVNTRFIEAIEDNTALLRNGHSVPIGKSYQEEFYRRLNKI